MLKVLQRVFDFIDWQLNHPSETVPGDMLNASFDAQNDRINELTVFVGGIRRSDGVIANDLVSWDSLDPALRAKITNLIDDAVEKATQAGAKLTKTALVNESRALRALDTAETAVNIAKSASEAVEQAKNAAIVAISGLNVAPAAPVPLIVSPTDDDFVGNSEQWAKASFDWAEYMGNEESHDLNATIPPTTLRMMDITGDHWSSRWWANRAANAFGEMYGLYLGAYPSPPNQGLNGEALQPGMIYWDTDDQQLYVWDGVSWHPMWAPSRASISQLNYQAVANQTVFDLATADINGDSYNLTPAEPVQVYVNGVRLAEDKGVADGDFTRGPSTTQITLLRSLRAGDMAAFDILMDPAKLQPVIILATKLQPLTGMNGIKVTFSLIKPDLTPATPGNAEDLLVSLDGVVQEPVTSYMVDGTAGTITFSTAPTADAHIFITWFAGGEPVSGGGGGITPPPSDGGEYVFRNGIWRLKSQSFILDGLTTLVVPVPVGARMVKIMGSVFPLIGNGVTAQVSVDGSTFITSTYYWGGASFNTGTDTTLLYPEGSSSAMFVTPTSNLTNFPHTFTAEMNLVRATTAKSFSMKSHGICHSDLPNRLLRTGLFNNWLDPAATSALSLKAFQLVSGSTFGTGSTAEVEWGY